MTAKIHTYESENITVHFDAKRCIHAAQCVGGLPAVFDPNARPWVNANAAPTDAIVRVIERCPSGALGYTRKDGGPAETAAAINTITVTANGPLHLRGALEISPGQGAAQTERRAALCRCGASQNKPYCDNSHVGAGFQDSGILGKPGVKAGAAQASRTLSIQPLANGPLMVKGPLEIHGGGATASGAEVYLCRCGASSNKPYCDGSHKKIGFSAS